jgi:hypothetical protein
VTGELFKMMIGVNMLHVPHRGASCNVPIVDQKKPGTRYPRVRASHSAVEDVNVPA